MGKAPEVVYASKIVSTNLWGIATAFYQIEGAVTEDGRGVSTWDKFRTSPPRHDKEPADAAV